MCFFPKVGSPGRVSGLPAYTPIPLTNPFLPPAAFHYISSADSPLLWIRIDPDMSILRKVEFEQADFMWQYQLRYERDVVAQVGILSGFNQCSTGQEFRRAYLPNFHFLIAPRRHKIQRLCEATLHMFLNGANIKK